MADVREQGPFFQKAAHERAIDGVVAALPPAAQELADAIRERAPVGATGKLKAKVRVAGKGLRVRVALTSPPYARVVEAGRKPAFIPIKRLTQWFATRVGLGNDEARRAAFALSRVRSRSAVPGKKFFFSTFDQLAPRLTAQLLGAFGAAIERELGG